MAPRLAATQRHKRGGSFWAPIGGPDCAPFDSRCAIYTRKSSEEGLDQAFNSLHAQRDACEAYVLSQAGEGWKALATFYDDGGFSGGSMERPALKALLADIDRGRIDIVIVYKVDRLTRSLGDFARIVEAFDKKEVSFVSVTQAFNTTSSMGRLTLNVLLSFAQFEREVTGERIRDKLAASKRKGMWMGGLPPIGYDAPTDLTTRALVVNEAEADLVRSLFHRYLELGSVYELRRRLEAEGCRSKTWITKKGRQLGGLPFNRGQLFYLLKNRIYRGQIVHKDQVYPGAHPAIVEADLFDRVQAHLARGSTDNRRLEARTSRMPLKGLIFTDAGDPMTPTFTRGKGSRTYRYYVASALLKGCKPVGNGERSVHRVSADLIWKIVCDALDRLTTQAPKPDPLTLLKRVEVHLASVQLTLRRTPLVPEDHDLENALTTLNSRLAPGERITAQRSDETLLRLVLPVRLNRRGGRVWSTDPEGKTISRADHLDMTLVKGLRAAHQLLAGDDPKRLGKLEQIDLQQGPPSPYHRNLCRIAFLAPDIQAMILEGRQPPNLTLQDLMTTDLPGCWSEQRRLLGIDPSSA